jgi:hypothetical protein
MDEVILPVHCCCTPGLRLGFLSVPRACVNRRQFAIVVREVDQPRWRELRHSGKPASSIVVAPIREIDLPIMPIELIPTGAPGIYETSVPVTMRRLAIESADQPIEVWRRVPGFREARRVYR